MRNNYHVKNKIFIIISASFLHTIWRARVVLISKMSSDIYRYNSAYRYPNELGTFTYLAVAVPDRTNSIVNCVSYSTRLWTFVMEDVRAPNNIGIVNVPDFVYYRL